jgi:hypothetical protein
MLNVTKSIVVSALLMLGIIYIFASSLDFQHCVYEYGKTNPDAKYFKEGVPFFVRSIPIYRHCIGDYVTSKHDVITAVFTIVIAIFTMVLAFFTVSLARSTRVAADAAAEGAQAESAIRRPRLMVSAVQSSVNVTGKGWAINYGIENFGTTPAILQQTSIQTRILPGLPIPPEYETPRIWRDRIIYGSQGISVKEGLRCSTPQGDDDTMLGVGDLEGGTKGTDLYFFGYLVFLDIFDKTRKIGFCFKINTLIGGMAREGGSAYNYDAEIKN